MKRILRFILSKTFLFAVLILAQICFLIALVVEFSRVGTVAYTVLTLVSTLVIVAVMCAAVCLAVIGPARQIKKSGNILKNFFQ